MSEARHQRGRVAALVKKGAPPEVIRAARRDLAAANVRRLAAVEMARQGLAEPSSDLEVLGFVAAVLAHGEAA